MSGQDRECWVDDAALSGDDVVQFEDSVKLVQNSGLPASAFIEVGSDHWLLDREPLAAISMLWECELESRNITGHGFDSLCL